MLLYLLINVRQLIFWLRYIYDINGVRGVAWVTIMGKPGIFQWNELLIVDGKSQYDPAVYTVVFFFSGQFIEKHSERV